MEIICRYSYRNQDIEGCDPGLGLFSCDCPDSARYDMVLLIEIWLGASASVLRLLDRSVHHRSLINRCSGRGIALSSDILGLPVVVGPELSPIGFQYVPDSDL